MVITVLQFELHIPHSESLKDKRRVVKSLKDRLHREHMVCVAEIGALDNIRIAAMAVACLSASAPYASEVLDRIVEKLKGLHDARLGELRRMTIHPTTAAEDDELAEDPEQPRDIWTPVQQDEIARSLGLEIEPQEDSRP